MSILDRSLKMSANKLLCMSVVFCELRVSSPSTVQQDVQVLKAYVCACRSVLPQVENRLYRKGHLACSLLIEPQPPAVINLMDANRLSLLLNNSRTLRLDSYLSSGNDSPKRRMTQSTKLSSTCMNTYSDSILKNKYRDVTDNELAFDIIAMETNRKGTKAMNSLKEL